MILNLKSTHVVKQYNSRNDQYIKHTRIMKTRIFLPQTHLHFLTPEHNQPCVYRPFDSISHSNAPNSRHQDHVVHSWDQCGFGISCTFHYTHSGVNKSLLRVMNLLRRLGRIKAWQQHEQWVEMGVGGWIRGGATLKKIGRNKPQNKIREKHKLTKSPL